MRVEYNHRSLKHTAYVKKQCFLTAVLCIWVVSVYRWSSCEILMEMKLIKVISHRILPQDALVYLLGFFFPFMTFLRIECSFDLCSREDKLVSILASFTLCCISSLHLSSPRNSRYQPTALGHATLSKKISLCVPWKHSASNFLENQENVVLFKKK